jgi:ribonuclease Z
VPKGPAYGRLQGGEAVELADGRRVEPHEVIGPARPGRKIVLAGDTAPSAGVLEVAQDADLIVHEATFSEEERERADETAHSTAAGAALLAREAGAQMLALTHLSNRYFGPEIAREARAIFPETVVPRDFDIIDVRFRERGGPRLVKGGARATREETESHDGHGSGDAGGGPRGSGGDPVDPALGGDRVGAAPGRGAAPGGAR